MQIKGKQIKDKSIPQDKLKLTLPVDPNDAATKEYVDTRGANIKEVYTEKDRSLISTDTISSPIVSDLDSDYLVATEQPISGNLVSGVEVFINGVAVDSGMTPLSNEDISSIIPNGETIVNIISGDNTYIATTNSLIIKNEQNTVVINNTSTINGDVFPTENILAISLGDSNSDILYLLTEVGIFSYDVENEIGVNSLFGDMLADIIPINELAFISNMEYYDNFLIVSTNNNDPLSTTGIWVYDFSTNTGKIINNTTGSNNVLLPNNSILDFTVNNGNVYIVSDNQIFVYELLSENGSFLSAVNSISSTINSIEINTVLVNDGLIIGTDDSLVFYFFDNVYRFVTMESGWSSVGVIPENNLKALPSNNILKISSIRNGLITNDNTATSTLILTDNGLYVMSYISNEIINTEIVLTGDDLPDLTNISLMSINKDKSFTIGSESELYDINVPKPLSIVFIRPQDGNIISKFKKFGEEEEGDILYIKPDAIGYHLDNDRITFRYLVSEQN